jgi:hypothetical protein
MSKATSKEQKTASETRNVSVRFSELLDDGEVLTGTPTILELVSTDLTIISKSISTAVRTINGVSTPIGEAVQYSVAGGTAGTTYDIQIVAVTDSTPAQTLYGNLELKIVADTA